MTSIDTISIKDEIRQRKKQRKREARTPTTAPEPVPAVPAPDLVSPTVPALRQALHAAVIGEPVDLGVAATLAEVLPHHPDAAAKIGPGIAGFVVRIAPEGSRSFYVRRTDGTEASFSYRKCIPDHVPGPGHAWSCRSCGTVVHANHIPGGWVSITRWPPEVRLGPIVTTFCSPACAPAYLERAGTSAVTYPTRERGRREGADA